MLKDTHTHTHTHTYTVNAQAGRGCEVEWHSSKPSSPLSLPLSLSKPPNHSPPFSPAQRNSLTASPQRHYGNQGATKAEREREERERGEGERRGRGGGEWGDIILLDGGYVSFPFPVMRKKH